MRLLLLLLGRLLRLLLAYGGHLVLLCCRHLVLLLLLSHVPGLRWVGALWCTILMVMLHVMIVAGARLLLLLTSVGMLLSKARCGTIVIVLVVCLLCGVCLLLLLLLRR